MRTKNKLILAITVAAIAWLVPSAAEAVAVRLDGVMAEEFNNWAGVQRV